MGPPAHLKFVEPSERRLSLEHVGRRRRPRRGQREGVDLGVRPRDGERVLLLLGALARQRRGRRGRLQALRVLKGERTDNVISYPNLWAGHSVGKQKYEGK